MSARAPMLRPVSALPPPAEVAARLHHLPGLVFLDSSFAEGASNAGGRARYSIVAARPTRIVSGELFDAADRARLEAVYAENRHAEEHAPDLGFPAGGLYGFVGYEGDFQFGEYHECLVYDHLHRSWMEQGWLSSQLERDPFPSDARSLSDLRFHGDIERNRFCAMVDRAHDYIAAGDIYQVNLSHRFRTALPDTADVFPLYRRLRERSPAPFSAYLSLGGIEVLSSSPEEFLGISGRTIRTRPIKGTRPRFRDRERDEKSAYDLITSSKEIAELIMITDLERNDLGRICEYGSVEATELLKLERYAQVFHLVSTVEGSLRPGLGPVDALHACFPGGSITGAPKKRAREIIAELEPTRRGLYTGTIGCLGFNGESRFNIAIRTAVREADELHFHVGAGIVADSVPEKEWSETLHKASGLFQACGSAPP